jgi:parallel beta-helix repeat protein
MNSRTLLISGALLVVLVLALPVSAAGPTNVLTVGPGQEYATIQAAVDAAKPGSRILVYPGYYEEAVSITTSNLQILAQGEGVVVEPPDTAGFDVHADQVTVRGFEILWGTECAAGIAFQGSHNTFADNHISFSGGECTGGEVIVCSDLDGGSDFNIVEGNTVLGADIGIAIQAVTSINRGNVIRDNTVASFVAPIAIYNGDGFLVSGNTIEGAGFGTCISVGAGGGDEEAQGHHTIVKNTMTALCNTHGISLHADSGALLTNNRVAENYMQNCGEDCLVLEADSGATLTHNQVISNSVSLSLSGNGVLLSADSDATVSDNLVKGNLVFHNNNDGIYLTPGADHNRILNNEVQTNPVGIAVAGDDNLIVGNWAYDNTLDLEDLGEGNNWQNNTYTTANW